MVNVFIMGNISGHKNEAGYLAWAKNVPANDLFQAA